MGQVVEREERDQLHPAAAAGREARIQCGVLQLHYLVRQKLLLLGQGEQGEPLKPIPTQMDFWALLEETLLLEHGLRLQKVLEPRPLHQEPPLLDRLHLLGQCFWVGVEALEVLVYLRELSALIPSLALRAGAAEAA